MEKWKINKDKKFPFYASTQGRIMSIERNVTAFLRRGNKVVKTTKKIKSKILSQREHNGYMLNTLTYNGKSKTRLVHRMILETFKPIKKNSDRKFVNHKNLNKSDNTLDNLEWVTRSENMRHAVLHGRLHTEKHLKRYEKFKIISKSFKRKTKINKKDFSKIFKSKKTNVFLAKKYGVSSATISRIKNGKQRTSQKQESEGKK